MKNSAQNKTNTSAEINTVETVDLPEELVPRYGIKIGNRFIDSDTDQSKQMPTQLQKLYVEPTNKCDLNCRTCMRNTWEEPTGLMTTTVFDHIIQGLKKFSPVPSVFFGGLGEPLFHPEIISMVARVKSLGANVELITNGTLLTPETAEQLIDIGIDTIWVSLDGATPESYVDIRLGANLSQVLENLLRFRDIRYKHSMIGDCCGFVPSPKTQLGIAFVAMKRNIKDLPKIVDIGRRLEARKFMVTNVLPYTRELVGETLYYRSLIKPLPVELALPILDIDDETYGPISSTIGKVYGSWASMDFGHQKDRCPFIEAGAAAINWEGNFSPCLPLTHSYRSYYGFLTFEERYSNRWSIGNVANSSLDRLWYLPEHTAFRERVHAFDFSPCTECGACDYFETNDEDCFGNKFPTCGGCLWSQGVIQCP